MEQENINTNGIWRIIPSMSITEIIIQSGFDFQILDCEHGSYDFQTLDQDIRVCKNNGCKVYVRVSGLNKVEVQRCLDLGADGIVFPQLNNFKDFESATKLISFPPHGIRGFNPFVRAAEFGYKVIQDTKVECLVIIETLNAVADLDAILQLVLLDTVYIGVYDLSAQLNCIGEMSHPDLIAIVNEIIEKCRLYSKRVMVMVKNKEELQNYKRKGVASFVHTVDAYLIKKSVISAKNDLLI
jgi:2-keto-3-deoxy-L-rhamnonate aldolase RhmA